MCLTFKKKKYNHKPRGQINLLQKAKPKIHIIYVEIN